MRVCAKKKQVEFEIELLHGLREGMLVVDCIVVGEKPHHIESVAVGANID